MKFIVNKQTDQRKSLTSEDKLSYSDAILETLDIIGDGIDRKEMKRRDRIEDAVNKSLSENSGIITLEDEDYATLKKILDTAKFKTRKKYLRLFLDDIDNASNSMPQIKRELTEEKQEEIKVVPGQFTS